MSFRNSTCDLCSKIYEHGFPDIAMFLDTDDDRFWCGHCEEGDEALFGHLSNGALREKISVDEEKLAENPIWAHIEDSTKNPDDMETHTEKLRLSLHIHSMHRLLNRREA